MAQILPAKASFLGLALFMPHYTLNLSGIKLLSYCLKIYFILVICVHICGGHRKPSGVILSFYHMSLETQTRVTILGGRHLYPLSRLVGPNSTLYKMTVS